MKHGVADENSAAVLNTPTTGDGAWDQSCLSFEGHTLQNLHLLQEQPASRVYRARLEPPGVDVFVKVERGSCNESTIAKRTGAADWARFAPKMLAHHEIVVPAWHTQDQTKKSVVYEAWPHDLLQYCERVLAQLDTTARVAAVTKLFLSAVRQFVVVLGLELSRRALLSATIRPPRDNVLECVVCLTCVWLVQKEALACFHKKCRLLHHDIKPQNLLTDGERVVLCDFGSVGREAGPAVGGHSPMYQVGQSETYGEDVNSLFISFVVALVCDSKLDERGRKHKLRSGPVAESLYKLHRVVVALLRPVDGAPKHLKCEADLTAYDEYGRRVQVLFEHVCQVVLESNVHGMLALADKLSDEVELPLKTKRRQSNDERAATQTGTKRTRTAAAKSKEGRKC